MRGTLWVLLLVSCWSKVVQPQQTQVAQPVEVQPPTSKRATCQHHLGSLQAGPWPDMTPQVVRPDGSTLPDMRMVQPPDLAMTIPDLAVQPPDLSVLPDLRLPSGCGDGGGMPVGRAPFLTGAAWACPGRFGAPGQPTAPMQCGKNFHVCRNTDSALLDMTACDRVAGAYLMQIPAFVLLGAMPYTVGCDGTWGTPKPRAWGMCGMSVAPYVVQGANVVPNPDCSPARRFLDCTGGTVWDCTGADPNAGVAARLAMTINKSMTDGVVCCAD